MNLKESLAVLAVLAVLGVASIHLSVVLTRTNRRGQELRVLIDAAARADLDRRCAWVAWSRANERLEEAKEKRKQIIQDRKDGTDGQGHGELAACDVVIARLEAYLDRCVSRIRESEATWKIAHQAEEVARQP